MTGVKGWNPNRKLKGETYIPMHRRRELEEERAKEKEDEEGDDLSETSGATGGTKGIAPEVSDRSLILFAYNIYD